MNESDRESLELQIDDLLNGGLDAGERARLLSRIACDDCARGVLREAVELQNAARTVYGYDIADAAIPDSLRRVVTESPGFRPRSIADGGPPPNGAAVADAHRGNRKERSPFGAFRGVPALVRIAAVVAIAASLYVALAARQDSGKLREELAALRRPMTAPGLTEDEMANFGKVWNEVLDRDRPTDPWVLLSDGGGQFGYIPAIEGAAAPNKLVLVRCILFNEDGESVSKVNLLLPGRRDVRLSLPEVALTDDLPVRYDVWVAGQQAGIGLTVGDETTGAGGVRGWTNIGESPTEIGQFMLEGKKLRVVLQALPLNVAAS